MDTSIGGQNRDVPANNHADWKDGEMLHGRQRLNNSPDVGTHPWRTIFVRQFAEPCGNLLNRLEPERKVTKLRVGVWP